MTKRWRVMLAWALAGAGAARADGFALVAAGRAAPIRVAAGEPEYVRLAAEDLASDVQRITGQKPEVTVGGALPAGACVLIGTPAGGGPWESYRVQAEDNRLTIAGGDARGTMFGVYAFIETYLKVDPLGYWSGREPARRAELTWPEVALVSGPPTFKFRGWFINDEDLLTFWKPGSKRELPYKFYGNVMHRESLRAVAEALVRSRFNLVIPASFIDILNPEEEALVRECARRGLYLSMHHQEPMGVSAWVYFNYWKARGKELAYSYFSQPEAVREVWRVYAAKWAEYPDVIWQLGLRGKGDRPMWQADPNTPQSDAERGRIISEAMAAQVRILDEVCPRKPRHMSTTLWAEGSVLCQQGLLTVPEGAIIVFADNSPGWKWQRDFYGTPRNPKNGYGVYYHHALIGCGPHLAQAVPPHKTCELLREAVQKGAADYAIFNVANVREFVLGIGATASMTWRLEGFEPEAWLEAWVRERFSSRQPEIADAYRIFFNAYQLHDLQKVPFLLDGQILSEGLRVLRLLGENVTSNRVGGGGAAEPSGRGTAAAAPPAPEDAFWASLSDTQPRPLGLRETVKRAAMQRQGFELALLHARASEAALPAGEAAFLRDNLIYPAGLMSLLTAWLEQLLLAREALDVGDTAACAQALGRAEAALAAVAPLEAAYCQGRWEGWYSGCVILDVRARLQRTRDVLAQVKALRPARPSFAYPPVIGGARVETYKRAGDAELKVWIFGAGKEGEARPAIVFFFGGGWQRGSPEQFVGPCRTLAERGMVAVVADYRVASRNRAKPAECVADAKSCVRWLRRNAGRLGIDPRRLAAGGGSAGGHLAAAAATLPELDDPGDDLSVSCVPDALVLFNPGLMMAPFGTLKMRGFGAGFSAEKFGCEAQAISPLHQVRAGMPPTLILHGTADKTTPFATAEAFRDEMLRAGNRCELVAYEGLDHGFYLADKYSETLGEMERFLNSLGYLAGK